MLRRRGLSLFALALLAGCNEDECNDAPGDLCLLVGTGEYGFNRDGLAGPDTDLYLPSAARLGPDGRVYVVDFNNQRLRRVDEQGRIETIAGSGFHAIATVGIPAEESWGPRYLYVTLGPLLDAFASFLKERGFVQ